MRLIDKEKRNIIFVNIVVLVCSLIIIVYYSRTGKESIKSNNIVINEVCSNNLSALFDENDDHPDWLELYNKGDSPISMKGWNLADSDNGKWEFPDIVIEPKQYLCIFADGSEEEEQEPYKLHASFKINGMGEGLYLYDSSDILSDYIYAPHLKHNTSYGRKPDGTEEFAVMIPTPGQSNEGAVLRETGGETPTMSDESGFYEDAFYLSMWTPDESRIYYTLDGSEPDEDSNLYSEPILISDRSDESDSYANLDEIMLDYTNTDYMFSETVEPTDKCTIVRAAAIYPDGRQSETVTETYFVGEEIISKYSEIGIISIAAEPEELFDEDDGIYVVGDSGDANFFKRGIENELKANLQYFDSEGEILLDKVCGVRINGGASSRFPEKSLTVVARNEYDEDNTLDFPFNDLDQDRIVLFSGGQDDSLKIKDRLVYEVSGDLNYAIPRIGDCVNLFLDGEYWGIYLFKDFLNEDLIEANYGVDKDDVVIVKSENGSIYAEDESGQKLFDEFDEYIRSTDFSSEENYENLCTMVDMDSMVDYYAARIFIEDGPDWPRTNLGMWRTRSADEEGYADGRWRFIMYDNNHDMHLSTVDEDIVSIALERNLLFYAAMQNEGFRKKLYDRFMELSETIYSTEQIYDIIDILAEPLRKPMDNYYRRFYGDNYRENYFDEQLQEL